MLSVVKLIRFLTLFTSKKSKISAWFLTFVLFISAAVIITQLYLIKSDDKNILVFLISLPLVVLILWLFFKTGLAAWSEKWIKSSYDDFLNEVEKGKRK